MRWKTGAAWIICTVLVLLVGGCSAVRLSYNQGPTLAYWWLDRYADFSSPQKPLVKAALADWLAWHRRTQLGDYQQALVRAQRLVLAPLTPELACGEFQAWQQRVETAVAQALPAVAELAPGLSAEQIGRIDKRNAQNLAEAETDYLQPDPADRREANFKRALERAETLYGRLDEPQRHVLAEALAASPFDAQLWLDERRARQQDLLRLLRQWQAPAARPEPAAVLAQLRALVRSVLDSPRPAYRAHAQRLTEANCALAAQLHNSTTAAQRRHAVERLKGWEEDLRVLQSAKS